MMQQTSFNKEEDMNSLKESIQKSKYRTQERFSEATGINEALISKYCRGLRKPSKGHAGIIKRFLRNDARPEASTGQK